MSPTIETKDFLVTNVDNAQLISVPSSFTSNEVDFFKQLLQQYSETLENANSNRYHSTFRKIIIDFGQTTFMNNDGLIGLCQIFNFARDKKIDLAFIGFSPQIRIILSLVGLEDILSAQNSNNFLSSYKTLSNSYIN